MLNFDLMTVSASRKLPTLKKSHYDETVNLRKMKNERILKQISKMVIPQAIRNVPLVIPIKESSLKVPTMEQKKIQSSN